MSGINTASSALSQVQRHAPLGDLPAQARLSVVAWAKILITSVLFGLLFWPNLWRLWGKTQPFGGEAEWQHALAIPLIGLYYLYANREELLASQFRPGWLGAPIALAGILLFAYGIWPGQNDFVKDFGMVVTLQPGKCYTIIAMSAPLQVSELDVRLQTLGIVTEAGHSPPTDKNPAILGRGKTPTCPISPIPLPYKVDVSARKGAGRVAVAVFSRSK